MDSGFGTSSNAASPGETNRPSSVRKTLCACGSGLCRLSCCGLDPETQADSAGYGALGSLAEAARRAHSASRNREAERHALALLNLAPLHRDGLRILFEIRRDEKRLTAAETLIQRLASLNPPAAHLHVQHAQLLMNQGRHRDAEAPARAGLALAPRDATVHHLIGVIFTETGRVHAGEQHYRLALNFLGVQDSAVLGNLAWNLKLQGRLDESATLYGAVLKLKGAGSRAMAGAAQVHAALGNLEQAETLITEARASVPNDRMIGLLQSLLLLRQDRPQGVLKHLEATEHAIAPQPLAASEFAVKGQALERLGRCAEAFSAYSAGRSLQRDRLGHRFNLAPVEARAQALREAYMADSLAALPRPQPIAQPVPVFLLGVHRSGTSLLEQLLCQVPHVDPADDRAPLNDLVRLLPKLVAGLGGPELLYPAALGGILAGEAREVLPMLAQRYIALLRARGVITSATRFVTDRSPDLAWNLGLVNLLFPNAPIIHVLRHPLDIVLSGFAQDRLYEGNAGVTLESLAKLYDVQMSMIGHFRGQMTLRYLPVRYEDLVANPAATLQQVFDFIGVAADPAALLAGPSRTHPRAPNYQFFREPLHRRGLYRHCAFGPVLDEAMPILGPWIERLGYGNTLRQAT